METKKPQISMGQPPIRNRDTASSSGTERLKLAGPPGYIFAGGAILPRVIAERYQQRYRFAVIALQDRWAQRRLCLCYQDDARLTPAMRSRTSPLQGR